MSDTPVTQPPLPGLISMCRNFEVLAETATDPTQRAFHEGQVNGINTMAVALGIPLAAALDSFDLNNAEPGFTISHVEPVTLDEAKVLISDLRLVATKATIEGAQLREVLNDDRLDAVVFRDNTGPAIRFKLGGMVSQVWRPDGATAGK